MGDKEREKDRVVVARNRLEDNLLEGHLGEDRCTHMAQVGLQNEAVGVGMTAAGPRGMGAERYMRELGDTDSGTDRVD